MFLGVTAGLLFRGVVQVIAVGRRRPVRLPPAAAAMCVGLLWALGLLGTVIRDMRLLMNTAGALGLAVAALVATMPIRQTAGAPDRSLDR